MTTPKASAATHILFTCDWSTNDAILLILTWCSGQRYTYKLTSTGYNHTLYQTIAGQWFIFYNGLNFITVIYLQYVKHSLHVVIVLADKLEAYNNMFAVT